MGVVFAIGRTLLVFVDAGWVFASHLDFRAAPEQLAFLASTAFLSGVAVGSILLVLVFTVSQRISIGSLS